MSFMSDIIRTLEDLGRTVRQARRARGLTAVEVARRSGRSRDLLHRLETGRDVSAAALLDVLRAMGHSLGVVPAGMPTLEEMRERFAKDEEE